MVRRQINVTFTEEEEELYRWLMETAKKHGGISRFIKRLLWIWYAGGDKAAEIIAAIEDKVAEKRAKGGAAARRIDSSGQEYICKNCGSPIVLVAKTQKYKIYYCPKCGVPRKTVVYRSESSGEAGEDKITLF